MYSEHAIVIEATQITLSLDKTWEVDPEEYERNLIKLLDFFRFYADKYHHYKEEEVLFPALLKTNEPTVTSIVAELLEHHVHFRDTLGKVRNDLAGKDYAGAQQKIKIYIDELLDHIAAENEELFPIADTLFAEDELEKLYYKCIDIDYELGLIHKEELENYIKNFKLKLDETAK